MPTETPPAAAAPLRFRATPWEDRSVRRVIEIAATDTLDDLHRALVHALALDGDHVWSFYLSGEWFDRTSELGGNPDFEGRGHVTAVGSLGLEPGDVVAYLCDFGTEQRVELEVVGFGDPANVPQRPRVIAREGELPAREKDEDEAEDEEDEEAAVERGPGDVTPVLALAPAGELEAALAAWDHDAADDGSRFALDPSRVAAALAAVLDACPSPRDLALLGDAHGVRLDAFVLAALRAVASRGDPDVALREARRFAAMVRMTVPLLATATAFAHAGRAAPAREALAAAEAFDAPFPQSARFAAAEIRTALGDFAGAEADLRQLVSRRWGSPRIRPAAAGALAHRLRESGRHDEAEAIALAERHRVERDAGVVRREAPRVGRNDPCPCGSGKKSKKCCGA